MKTTETASSYPKFGKRHILALWLFTGFVNCYILRVSINVAIVSMVNGTHAQGNETDSLNDTCPYPDEGNRTAASGEGEFNWDHETQGIILSSFYYGYICTQFIGGYLVQILGARLLFGIGVGGTAALTLLNPIAARTSVNFLIALRVTEGLLEGVTFPSSHYIISSWAPKTERSLLVIFPLSGTNIGTILAAPLTGLLCQYGFDGGWASSFYVFGALALLWCVGWFYFVHDTPAKHPTISPEERAYLEEHCNSSAHSIPFSNVPWKAMILTPAVWAVTVAHTAYNWNFYTLLTEMSTYLKDVLHISTSLNGIVTSIPYVCLWLLQIFTAFISDILRKRGWKTKIVRKMFYGFGMVTSAGFLIIISYVGCDTLSVILLLCLGVGIAGMGLSGFIANHVDIAPQYAGILMGVTNTFATLPGILSPLLAGAITNEHSSIATWQIVFYISAGVSLFGAIIFVLFAEGEIQPWASSIADGSVTNINRSKADSQTTYGTDEALNANDTEAIIRQR